MGKIALITPGEEIARYGRQLKATLNSPDRLTIINAHMEDAVKKARALIKAGDIDVLISRGTTGKLLERANLNIPCTMIPVGEHEVLACIQQAKKITGLSSPHLGFLDFDSYITPLTPFLSALNIPVSEYTLHSSEEIPELIRRSKADHCDVLIGGRLCFEEAQKRQIPSVPMGSSLDSLRLAYRQARKLQQAVNLEKQKAQEQKTILDTVTDAIISISTAGKITLVNKKAELILQSTADLIIGQQISSFLSPKELQEFQTVLQTGEESIGRVWNRQGNQYAVRIVPIWTSREISGILVSLLEVKTLQAIETNVRIDLQKKGNVAYYTFDDILGESPQILEAANIARNFARMQSNVLIVGETGTGKELFAQSIHNASPRSCGPFVAVNCGAIPSELVESELFGYSPGAFTGAKKGGKAGLFELAHNGTIFLDEISEMSLNAQVKLLRVIQERQVRRIGSDSTIPINVRIIAACNVDLYSQVQRGDFRQDLYYRLSILVVKLPPLKGREGDISLLASHFLRNYNRQFGREGVLSEAACRELERLDWPGNIRQLRNFCERLAAVHASPLIDGTFIRKQYEDSFNFSNSCTLEEDHGAENKGAEPGLANLNHKPPLPLASPPSGTRLMIKGRFYGTDEMLALLEEYRGSRSRLAKALGISRTTLWKYLKQLNL